MNDIRNGSQAAGEGKPPAYPQAGVANTCRAFKEYEAMFRLTEADWIAGPVLDVAGGGSSFTAHLRGIGALAYAADPFYAGLTEQVIAGADWVVELGPDGGESGGYVVASGPPRKLARRATATGVVLREMMQRTGSMDAAAVRNTL